MTTLYKPVLIESVEQARSLPLSTRAIRPDGQAAARLDGVSEDGQWTAKLRLYAHDEVIGWTALVPIDAEEETVEHRRLCRDTPDVLHRYVTPWTHYTPQEDQ
jgi:hypothetical protein